MNKIRREYLDPSSPANVKKLNSDLSEIHNIMTQSIQDMIQRGEKLDGKCNKSIHKNIIMNHHS